MEKYPDLATYMKLYQRFCGNRSAEDLINLAGAVTNKTVLDLCGGSGKLSFEAIKRGAKTAWLVEREKKMISSDIWLHPRIKVFVGTVESRLKEFVRKKNKFDCIVSQQAVNYWLNKNTVELLVRVLAKKGVFVFNTFNHKPSEKPTVKEYEIGENKFVEVSWLIKDLVYHVQIREGMPCHTTSFYWLSPEHLAGILEPYFSVTVKKESRTSLYRCLKK